MKNNISFDKRKKNSAGGKLMYAALALGLIGALGATWYAVNSSIKDIDENLPFVSEEGEKTEENMNLSPSSPQQDTEQLSDSESSENTESSIDAENSNEEQQVSLEQSPTLYIMPVQGEIIVDFSDHKVVKNETLGDWRTHDGIDISASVLTPVKCVNNGTVKEVYNDNLLGTVVVVSHSENIESYYCNLNELVNVEVGQEVTVGHVLGSVGASAILESEGKEHLHFAMKENGEWVDPLKILGKE